MKEDELNIKAIKLLEMEERLLRDIQELKAMINAPERVKKATKRELSIAKFRRF